MPATNRFLYGTSKNITKTFTYIDWSGLCELVKKPVELEGRTVEKAKNTLPVIAANDATDKTKETVLQHDNFTMLRLDLDDTELSLNGVADKLTKLGFNSFIIHTSASHLHDGKGNRFRVFIQIASSVTYDTWATLETYLSFLFGADDCASRPQQIMFAPLETESYDYKLKVGDAFDVMGSELQDKAKIFKSEQEAKLAEVQNEPVKPAYKPKLVGKQVSIIDAVNSAYDWPSLLYSFGYKQQGKAWLPPESTSKAAGAYILISNSDGKERYFSHHESDPCATGRSIDKFDFLCIRVYSCDEFEAIKEISKASFPDIDKHNKREYAVSIHNTKVSNMLERIGGEV